MFYRFDIIRWVLMLMPPVLRRPLAVALVSSMLYPAREIYDRFSGLKTDVDLQLTSNAFTIYLERYLNRLFYLTDEIYISDFVDDNLVYFAFADEIADTVWVGDKEDDGTLYLSSLKPDYMGGGFTVNIPEFLNKDEHVATIRRWVDRFKFAGTKYTIQAYS